MKSKELGVLILIATVMCFASCDGSLTRKAAEEKKLDSLFLGISMGMEKKAFYDYCWKMNNEKIFSHGPTNQSVEYVLKSELDRPVTMQFYPNFYEEKIYEMPVLFNYEAWAPWNREFSADSLVLKLLPVFKKWYGDDFQTLQHPVQGTVYYQMKGRRRINLFVRDDQFVQAVFTNLKVEKEIKEMQKEKSNAQ